ncbi:C-factor [compost metagenome]
MGSVADNLSGGLDLYRASKAALNSLTRSLAAGLGDSGVTVLNLHPGWVRTDMGGEQAPVEVQDSVRGLVDQVERFAGRGGQHYLDYQGEAIAW